MSVDEISNLDLKLPSDSVNILETRQNLLSTTKVELDPTKKERLIGLFKEGSRVESFLRNSLYKQSVKFTRKNLNGLTNKIGQDTFNQFKIYSILKSEENTVDPVSTTVMKRFKSEKLITRVFQKDGNSNINESITRANYIPSKYNKNIESPRKIKEDEDNSSDSSYDLEDNPKVDEVKQIQIALKSELNVNTESRHSLDVSSDDEVDLKKEREKSFRSVTKRKLVYDSFSEEEIEEVDEVIVHPDSDFIFYFHFILYIAFMYYVLITPIYLAHIDFIPRSFSTLTYLIEVFIDFAFLIDIIISMITPYYAKNEAFVTSRKKILLNYRKKWLISDLISSIPFHTLLFSFHIKYCAQTHIEKSSLFMGEKGSFLPLFLLVRFVKILKILTQNTFIKYLYIVFVDNRKAALMRMMNFVLYFLIASHTLACIFIFLGNVTTPNWILMKGLQDADLSDIYTAALYFIFATLITVGYGDLSSVNIYERVFNVLILLTGVFIFSYGVSSLSNLMLEKGHKDKEYDENFACLEKISKKYELKPSLKNSINSYLKYKLRNCKDLETSLLNELPTSLRNQMIMKIYFPIIKNFVFFKKLAKAKIDFTVRAVLAMRPINASRNDVLVNEGDFVEEIIFIKKGRLVLEVEVKFTPTDRMNTLYDPEKKITCTTKSEFADLLTQNKEIKLNIIDEKKTFVKLIELRNNEHFGDVLMFLNKRSPLIMKVKSKKAQLYSMKKEDVINISTSYPQIFKKICKKSVKNQRILEDLIEKSKSLFFESHKNKRIKSITPINSRNFNNQHIGQHNDNKTSNDLDNIVIDPNVDEEFPEDIEEKIIEKIERQTNKLKSSKSRNYRDVKEDASSFSNGKKNLKIINESDNETGRDSINISIMDIKGKDLSYDVIKREPSKNINYRISIGGNSLTQENSINSERHDIDSMKEIQMHNVQKLISSQHSSFNSSIDFSRRQEHQNEDDFLCNLNNCNNIIIGDQPNISLAPFSCIRCDSCMIPITANRMMHLIPMGLDKYRESLTWTNIKQSQASSFEIIKEILPKSPITSAKIPNTCSNTSLFLDLERKESKLAIPNTQIESSPVLSKRDNSIRALSSMKKDIMQKRPSFMLNVPSDNGGAIFRDCSVSNKRKTLLDEVSKGIELSNLNINAPKSFYSELLLNKMNDKQNVISNIKFLNKRLKDIEAVVFKDRITIKNEEVG